MLLLLNQIASVVSRIKWEEENKGDDRLINSFTELLRTIDEKALPNNQKRDGLTICDTRVEVDECTDSTVAMSCYCYSEFYKNAPPFKDYPRLKVIAEASLSRPFQLQIEVEPLEAPELKNFVNDSLVTCLGGPPIVTSLDWEIKWVRTKYYTTSYLEVDFYRENYNKACEVLARM